MVSLSVRIPRKLPTRVSVAATCTNGMFALPRALVSQNKRRYKQGGYDLDLCYLHPRVIVMGFPAVGIEFAYRNPRSEVVRFLEDHHEDNYFVYNFCAEKERCYPASVFAGRIKCFPIEDHNVPTFEQLMEFSDHAAAWLDADPNHIVALHCKVRGAKMAVVGVSYIESAKTVFERNDMCAGKGRAGMMACVLLVRMQFANSAGAAIERYNQVRVHDLRGLTVISQRKWVKYYEQFRMMTSQNPRASINEPGFLLKDISIHNTLTAVTPPQLRLQVYQLDNTTASKTLLHQAVGYEQFSLHEEIRGSVLVELKLVQCGNCRVQKHFKVWFNTLFISPDAETGRVVFKRNDMDWVSKDKKKRRIPAAMELELVVERQ